MQIILVGGFLGSGKTTAIQHACETLVKQNKRVAVITNDQGIELVDSKFLSAFLIPVKEILNGCFCCNYNDLLQNIYYFSEHINPDFIFAESVGSCTDMIATIAKPLSEMHPELVVSISVFVDAYLLHSLINGTSSFIDDSVRYIFKKQMEEADILILNKIDLLTNEELAKVIKMIEHDHPTKKILLQNSLNKHSIENWLTSLNDKIKTNRNPLIIDYNIYGEGEAKLAWLDATLSIKTKKQPALKVATIFADMMHKKIKQKELTIGHLKFLIDDGESQQKISYTTAIPSSTVFADGQSTTASIIVNARVQTEPERLKKIFQQTIDEIILKYNSTIETRSLSVFQPGFPKPTYRIS